MADSLGVILAERARSGVRVFFLYDAFGSSLTPRLPGAAPPAGVRTAAFRPLRFRNLWWCKNRRTARRGVDGEVGWTVASAIDDKWLGDARGPAEWRETNIRFEGPAVIQLESAFVAAWTEATATCLNRARVMSTARRERGARRPALHGADAGQHAGERYSRCR